MRTNTFWWTSILDYNRFTDWYKQSLYIFKLSKVYSSVKSVWWSRKHETQSHRKSYVSLTCPFFRYSNQFFDYINNSSGTSGTPVLRGEGVIVIRSRLESSVCGPIGLPSFAAVPRRWPGLLIESSRHLVCCLLHCGGVGAGDHRPLSRPALAFRAFWFWTYGC